MNKTLKARATGAPTTPLQDALAEIDGLLAKRKFGDSMDRAHALLSRNPDNLAALQKMAQVQEACKEYETALSLFGRVHSELQRAGHKTDLGVLLSIANCQLFLDRREEARSLLLELYKLVPLHPDVQTLLAAVRLRDQQFEEAEKLLSTVLKAFPNHRRANHEMARLKLERGDKEGALPLLERNIRCEDIYGDSIDLWLVTLSELNRNRYAQEVMEELAKAHPTMVEFVFGNAVLANQAGEISLARPSYQRALELSPRNHRILYELGVLERTAGNLDVSQGYIAEALKLKPDNPAALRTYTSDIKLSYGDENFARLNFAAASLADYSPIEQVHMHYALAKAFDDVGELDTAFRHYEVGGLKKRKLETYSDKDAARINEVLMQVVTRERVNHTGQTGFKDETPVFVLGMPRSGTSLMEQILSAHPEIFGAGELRLLTGVLENITVGQARLQLNEKDPVFSYEENATWEMRGRRYVERLHKLTDKPYRRVVDKMPGNFNFVGLIHSILPNAKIIHSRRHPVETCLSCYRIHFAEGHQWTYNLRELGRFYRRYWELMEFWRKEFPGVMLEVRYEDNVADVEGEARRIIDHLGLEWNENCLNFYNLDRPVMTASVTQVRKPIYKTSTNRWRKYEKYLGPLLDELGDIVPQYEAEIAHLAKS